MRITDIETFVVDADWRNWFFVQVTTDEGITGVGEALSGEGVSPPRWKRPPRRTNTTSSAKIRSTGS